jgi:hypothetical protein
MRFLWICIFLSARFLGNAQASYADSLFKAGSYLEAGVEYERLIFEGSKNLTPNEILLRKSYCYKEQGNFEMSLETLQRSDYYSGSDSIRFQLFYESVLSAYLSGRFDLSLSLINELHYNFDYKTNFSLDVLEIMALAQLMKWKEAKNKFNTLSTQRNLSLDTTIFDQVFKRKFKKPEKALTLSYLLPGSGLIYAGAPVRGITSAGLQTGAMLMAIHGLKEGYFFSGALTGAALFYVFYNGGAQYAATLSANRNEARINNFKADLVKALRETGTK